MQPAVQPPGCGPPRTLPLSPPEGTQTPSPPLGAGLRPSIHSPFPGTPSAHPGGWLWGAGSRHPSIVSSGPPAFQSPPWALSPPLSTGVPVGPRVGEATPLGTLTFQDRDVDGGPQAGQPHPRVPVTHVGTRAGGGGGPGWTAALHARPARQPQAAPGPSGQRQEQQEGRGHHPGQGLGPGRKGRERWERKAGSGGLALLSPQRPPWQPGSSPVWGRQWGGPGSLLDGEGQMGPLEGAAVGSARASSRTEHSVSPSWTLIPP